MTIFARMRRRVAGQAGVAMITVLFVGAALTVVTSTAAFVTIREFGASNDDRTSTQALAVAEAGLDRIIQKVKTTPWSDLLRSGCVDEDLIAVEGVVGSGSFSAFVETEADCPPAPLPDPFEPQFVEIESAGSVADATRTVRQRLRVVSGGLPIGVYAYDFITASGEGAGNKFDGISLITQGNVNSREKLSFTGFDPWLTQFKVYGEGPNTRCRPTVAPCTYQNSLPAAVHAGGIITCDAARTCSDSGKTEHISNPDTNLSCTANGTKGGANASRSAWDGSANGGDITGTCAGRPAGDIAPTSLFTVDDAKNLAPNPSPDKIDFEALKTAAQESGIYCSWDAGAKKPICTKAGGPGSTDLTFQNADIAGLPEDFMVYFDFPLENPPIQVNWQATAGDCLGDRTTVLVARNSDVDMNNGTIAGAVIASEGTVKVGGGGRVHGTIIAQTIDARGNSEFKMDECAVNALTAPFINVTQGRWSEADRL